MAISHHPVNSNKQSSVLKWKENSLLNKSIWENWPATCRRMKLDHSLTSYTKINSKWMKDLNMRQESIKTLEEDVGSNLYDISHSKLLGLHQDKNLLHSKESVKETKRR